MLKFQLKRITTFGKTWIQRKGSLSRFHTVHTKICEKRKNILAMLTLYWCYDVITTKQRIEVCAGDSKISAVATFWLFSGLWSKSQWLAQTGSPNFQPSDLSESFSVWNVSSRFRRHFTQLQMSWGLENQPGWDPCAPSRDHFCPNRLTKKSWKVEGKIWRMSSILKWQSLMMKNTYLFNWFT